MQKEFSIAVIGLGLIGGSILKKLKNTKNKLIGVSARQETIDKALKEQIISEGSTNIGIIKDADIIFICTPINITLDMLKEVILIAKPECIITDVAGVKGFIMDFVNKNNAPVNFIGGHPMAGTENKGLDASDSNMFEKAKWVLTPSKWAQNKDVDILKQIINELGAEVIVADAYEHDKAVALISHFPLFLSQSLFDFVNNYPDKETGRLAMKLAASGFRDMTRLAATNPTLATDMLFQNRENVVLAYKEYIEHSKLLENELVEQEENFIKHVNELVDSRKKMYSPEGKNISY
ncbi:MAG TPA: prephenate dehydrogenase/arogenate dehydrogenase family protein [Candidatus Gastranaerophilales bacterium]|nr:prephenate dehydrogenase/arogenate dehydrogenase family protein [Candidatus Gastranaerophilales bacterium]